MTFSSGIEMEHWADMEWTNVVLIWKPLRRYLVVNDLSR